MIAQSQKSFTSEHRKQKSREVVIKGGSEAGSDRHQANRKPENGGVGGLAMS